MPCLPITDSSGTRVGIVCGFHPLYDFGGFVFEIHRYFGPCPLRRDNHEPRKIPAGFWPVWERFAGLAAAEREKYRVEPC